MSLLLPRTTRPFGLLLASDARDEGWSAVLRTSIRHEDVVKVRPGAYIERARWDGMTPEERHLTRIHAVAATFTNPVFARQSAAIAHGLPVLRSRLDRLHLIQTSPKGSGRRGDVSVHAFDGDPDIVAVAGLRLTSVTRTVLDLARVLPHGEALAIADAAVRPQPLSAGIVGTGRASCTPDDLLAALETAGSKRAGWAAYLVAAEADARSGSVGESMARSLFLRLGAPRPDLQVALHDRDGLIGYGDFAWPEYGVVGEFDGRLKYGADNPSGRSPEEVVYREKVREDRIRRVSAGFFRLGWKDLDDPSRVAEILTHAGLPLHRARAEPALRRHVLGSTGSSRLT